MKNRRIVSILLILVSLAALLLLPAQVLAGNPVSPEDAIYRANPVYPADAVYSLAAAPKPISDLSKAVPDSTAYLNKADPGNPDYAKIKLKTRTPTPPPASEQEYDHRWWGSGIESGTNVLGVYAGQAIRPTLDLPPVPVGGLTTELYAPTLLLPNYCPVESVTVYERTVGASSTTRAWGVWNHSSSSGGFVVWKDMDAQFLSNYVRCWEGPGQEYFVTVLKSGSNYHVLLFNFNTGKWECQYTTSSGSSPWSYGWDMWEIYKTEASWPTLPDIQTWGIQVLVHGSGWSNSWSLLNSTYGWEITNPGDMLPYRKLWISQYDAWYVGP